MPVDIKFSGQEVSARLQQDPAPSSKTKSFNNGIIV